MTEIITSLSVIGFLTVTCLNLFYPMSINSNGWRLVYTCLIFGFLNVFFSFMISKIPFAGDIYFKIFDFLFSEIFKKMSLNADYFKLQPLAFILSIFITPRVWGSIYINYFQDEIDRINTNFKEVLYIYDNNEYIYITLKDGKVYVGTIFDFRLDSPNLNDRYIQIIPFLSGHRVVTNKIIFTTNYFETFKGKEENLENLRISIFQSEISRFSKFDEEAAKNFDLNF